VSPGLQHAITRLHVGVFRASRGRVGGRIWGLPILLLTTTGRRSGRQRTTPLCYVPHGEAYVVIASNGGAARHPDWWLNLLHTPRATIEAGRVTEAVRAREAASEERRLLWAEITSIAPGYLRYQERTRRTIPLGVLERG
jgi:F420H(2)-dependent quinone reductase